MAEGKTTFDTSPGAFVSPAQRVGAPEHVDWHMILDQELTQLSQPDSGVMGSIGFTALGGFVGLIPGLAGVITKLSQSPTLPAGEAALPIGFVDVVTVAATAGCLIGAVICLITFAVNKYRNAGLTAKIRQRKKFSAPAGAP